MQETISDILEAIKIQACHRMTKDMFVQYGISRSILETDAYDLLVDGILTGPDATVSLDLLRKYIEDGQNYDYMVTDNEAGLEHISRKIIFDGLSAGRQRCHHQGGIRSAGRVMEIAGRVGGIEIGKAFLIISRGDTGGRRRC